MPPTTSRDFQKVAAQRLATAQILLKEKLTLDAQYLAGYTVECSLKALILHVTPAIDQPDKLRRLTSGAAMHRWEVLLGELHPHGIFLPVELAGRIRRFKWSTALRYETKRRDTGETIACLATAEKVLEWVEEQLP